MGLPLPQLSLSLTAHKGLIPLPTPILPLPSSLQHMAGARSLPAKDRHRLFKCSPTEKEAETPFTEILCCSFEFDCISIASCTIVFFFFMLLATLDVTHSVYTVASCISVFFYISPANLLLSSSSSVSAPTGGLAIVELAFYAAKTAPQLIWLIFFLSRSAELC